MSALQAIILICDLAVSSLADCDRSNAVDVVVVPSSERILLPAMCNKIAQEYLASTDIGRGDTSYRERIKVICKRAPTQQKERSNA